MRRMTLTLGLAALATALCVTPALAAQTNTYSVKAKITRAKAVKFGFAVNEATGLQPAAVKKYTIGFAGLKPNAKVAGKKGALIGTGKIANYVYLSQDPSGAGGFDCLKDLSIYSMGKGKATLNLTGPAATCGGVGNLPPIPAKFVPFAGGGTALQFELHPTIMHPITGLTVAVRSVDSTLKRGVLTPSRAKKHKVAATFVTEDGQSTTVRTTA